MPNGTPKRRRDQPESDADSIARPGQANQQVASSDLFGGGRREKTSSLRRPEVERSPRGAWLGPSCGEAVVPILQASPYHPRRSQNGPGDATRCVGHQKFLFAGTRYDRREPVNG